LSSEEKSKIFRKSAPSISIGGNLFKFVLDQILRRCVTEEEVFDILLTFHDGPCGGYYWPTIHEDVKNTLVSLIGARGWEGLLQEMKFLYNIK